VVFVVAIAVVIIVNVSLPRENTTPTGPTQPELPQVIGGNANSSLKNLRLGTSIDNSGLTVTVKAISVGPVAADGRQVYIVEVDFVNNRDSALMLYSTQWMLETSEGTRLDTYVGFDVDGGVLTSNFSDYELRVKERFTGRLYFAITPLFATEEEIEAGIEVFSPVPAAVVYQPSALTYSEDLLVTWRIES